MFRRAPGRGRALLSRVFTPKKMNALETQIREFCARSLDFIEWLAKHPSDDIMTELLKRHPDQRGEPVDDPMLIPNAIEELLRFEAPAPHVCRCTSRDVEHQRPRRARGKR